ncbi:hypothetical protein [Paenibacillus yonginensis]|uniref:hypothetical protein n=1 Tax=Paenibacillus yonginensis TaxID=1462996 RepID=UPI0014715366|nr:hypothetical protein [Paenibacillus yonginensis]
MTVIDNLFKRKGEWQTIQKLGQGIFDLNLQHSGMHPVLIWSDQDGATLMDTGMVERM